MLTAVLGILKIIGTVLLVILLIILCLVLLILFVPVRYRGKGSYEGKPAADIRAGWLFNLIRFRFCYDGEADAWAKILFFRVWSLRPEIRKPKDEQENMSSGSPEAGAESTAEYQEDRTDKEIPDVTYEKETEEGKTYSGHVIQGTGSEETTPAAEEESSAEEKTEEKNSAEKAEDRPEKKKNRKSPVQRIKNFLSGFSEKWNRISDKYEKISRLISDPRNKRLFSFLVRRLKRVLSCVLPKKISGTVKYGFEDPYTTGQVLSWLALLIPVYRDRLKVIPVFEKKELEAEGEFRGSIHLFILVFTGLEVWFNRDFKRFLKYKRKYFS
jgi:hypothetical protein